MVRVGPFFDSRCSNFNTSVTEKSKDKEIRSAYSPAAFTMAEDSYAAI